MEFLDRKASWYLKPIVFTYPGNPSPNSQQLYNHFFTPNKIELSP